MKKMPNISQGKVMTRLRCGGIFKDLCLINLPTSLTAVHCENQSASGKATRTEWHLFKTRSGPWPLVGNRHPVEMCVWMTGTVWWRVHSTARHETAQESLGAADVFTGNIFEEEY